MEFVAMTEKKKLVTLEELGPDVVVMDGNKLLVTMEQAGPDVIVRVNGYGVVAFRGAGSMMAVADQARVDAGLQFAME